MRVEIAVFDGVDELDVFGTAEPLFSAGLDVQLAALGTGPIRTQRGIAIEIDAELGRGAPDVVLVPGGGWGNHAPQGSWAEAERGELPRRLTELAGRTRFTASVCTGAMLLEAAGLLTGRTATTNHNARDELRALGVSVLDERVVDDGDVVTAGGLSAGLDLGVWIVERLLGTETADRVCTSLEYTRQGRVYRTGRAAGGVAQPLTDRPSASARSR